MTMRILRQTTEEPQRVFTGVQFDLPVIAQVVEVAPQEQPREESGQSQNARDFLAPPRSPRVTRVEGKKTKPRISESFSSNASAVLAVLPAELRDQVRRVENIPRYEQVIAEAKEFNKTKRKYYAELKRMALEQARRDFERSTRIHTDGAVAAKANLKEALKLKPKTEAAKAAGMNPIKAELAMIGNMPLVDAVSLHYKHTRNIYGLCFTINTTNITTAETVLVNSSHVKVPQVLLPRLHITISERGAWANARDTAGVGYKIPFLSSTLDKSGRNMLCLGDNQAHYMDSWRKGQYALCFALVLQIIRSHMNASAGFMHLEGVLSRNQDVPLNTHMPIEGEACTVHCPALWLNGRDIPTDSQEAHVLSYNRIGGIVEVKLDEVQCMHDCGDDECVEDNCEHSCDYHGCPQYTFLVYNAPEFITFNK